MVSLILTKDTGFKTQFWTGTRWSDSSFDAKKYGSGREAFAEFWEVMIKSTGQNERIKA